jgi:hypothetical protein
LKHKWSAVKLARPGEDNEPNQAPASRPTAVDRFRALSPVSQEALLQQREQRRYVATQMLSCESSDRLTAVLALKTQQKESVCAHHHRGLYLPNPFAVNRNTGSAVQLNKNLDEDRRAKVQQVRHQLQATSVTSVPYGPYILTGSGITRRGSLESSRTQTRTSEQLKPLLLLESNKPTHAPRPTF